MIALTPEDADTLREAVFGRLERMRSNLRLERPFGNSELPDVVIELQRGAEQICRCVSLLQAAERQGIEGTETDDYLLSLLSASEDELTRWLTEGHSEGRRLERRLGACRELRERLDDKLAARTARVVR